MEKPLTNSNFLPDPHQNLVLETIPLNDIRRTYPKRFEEMMNNINIASFYETFLTLCADPDNLVVAIHCETNPHRQFDPMYREVQSLKTLQKYFATRMQTIPDAVFAIEKSLVYRLVQPNKKKKKGSELHLHFQLTGSIISETIWKNAETSLDLNFAVNSLSSMATTPSSSTSSHSSSVLNSSLRPPLSTPNTTTNTRDSHSQPLSEDINHIIKRSSEQMLAPVAPTRRKRRSSQSQSKKGGDLTTITSETSTHSSDPSTQVEEDLNSRNSSSKVPRFGVEDSNRTVDLASTDSKPSQIVIQQLDPTTQPSSTTSTTTTTTTPTAARIRTLNPPLQPIIFHLPQHLSSESDYQQVKVGTSVFLFSKESSSSHSCPELAYRSTVIATKDTDFSIGNKIVPQLQQWRGVLILHLSEDHKIQRITTKYVSEVQPTAR